ncbi:integrator complex subunit 2 [Arctopsyche grandis]|uniref:integrator complex subunit 2 n=1 Tax=Arctopsyche grandis TaxID=121162 RepID=UPI00406D6CF2
MSLKPVPPHVFEALEALKVQDLLNCTPEEIRAILPCLVRMALISPLDIPKYCAQAKKDILTLLAGIELVNSMVSLLSIEFHALEHDLRKEQQMRQKPASSRQESFLIQNIVNGLATEFERSDPTRRVRLVLSELLQMQSQIAEYNQSKLNSPNSELTVKPSELFDNDVYLEEISDIICICLAELPILFNITDVCETLLYINKGPSIICWVVANMPDSFKEVVNHLVWNAERGEEECGAGGGLGARARGRALAQLCTMAPGHALAVRAKCVEACRLPALAVSLTLDNAAADTTGTNNDVVAFISGLLLGSEQSARNWLAGFLRGGQKRSRSGAAIGAGANTVEAGGGAARLRAELLRRLRAASGVNLRPAKVLEAAALLRLYCAFRGIAGIKFHDEEVASLIRLVTSKPSPTPAGVRFVSLSLCMIIACPTLIAAQEHDKKAIDWIQWLVKEEAYFESASGVTASFGEMLLLMAIHFHSNQLSAICDLVCSTLGMKVPIRPNNMTRIKTIFTQDIFTEQVVTAHAVKVPVTVNLNGSIPGYLPVHCIHQLLKSRAFSKHKVPIKNWIYKQICKSVAPLHPVLPALVEVYVNSILISNAAKGTVEYVNKPITEEEIRNVFRNSVFGAHFDTKKRVYNLADIDDTSNSNDDIQIEKPSLTSQLLLLYYLLLYEDVRLANTTSHMANGKKVKCYSTAFLSELPIKYLLHQAQSDQLSYGGLFSPLLRLLATHFPHLSLVDDWMDDQIFGDTQNASVYHTETLSEMSIIEAFSGMENNPSKASRVIKQMLMKSPTDIWPFAETYVHFFKTVLGDKVSRHIQELYRQVWLRLNTVLPRSLWVMSINALLDINSVSRNVTLTQENILVDPLQVLRCDLRVFRCGPILKIVLRILEASLAASRSQLSRHLHDKPLLEKSGQLSSDTEREELKNALVAAQESSALQILLETCLETDDDRAHPELMWSLREVRSIVCSFLHQIFISEPSLAKLVHFQGYPRDLLPVTVQGIPSMHICLDFIPELLSQASLEKQVFAIDLVSHLSIQYSLPKAMSIARLCVNTLSVLLSVLPCDLRVDLFQPVLRSLVRICTAFPPLLEEITSLLMQLGRVCESQASLGHSWNDVSISGDLAYTQSKVQEKTKVLMAEVLSRDIQNTMSEIIKKALLDDKIY